MGIGILCGLSWQTALQAAETDVPVQCNIQTIKGQKVPTEAIEDCVEFGAAIGELGLDGQIARVGGALPNEPAFPVTGPGTAAGHRDRWRSRVRGLPEFAGELPVSVLAEEILTPGEGQLRALLTCAGNPVLSTPDGRGLDAALAGLDFMVSIDVYLNETTRHADLILPPASPLTQDHYDSIFNAFAVRRVARLNRALHPRRDDERADWEIVNGLGAAYAASAGKQWQALPPPRDLIAIGLARGDSGLDLAALAGVPACGRPWQECVADEQALTVEPGAGAAHAAAAPRQRGSSRHRLPAAER